MSTQVESAKATKTAASTSIWKAKDEKRGGPRKTSPKPAGIRNGAADQKYSPKLNVVEDPDAKTVLVKINARTQIRQIINYCLGKIRDSWKVTLNAF